MIIEMMVGLILIAIPYAVCLAPIILLLITALQMLAMDRKDLEQVLEGVAASSFLAVLASLMLTRGVGVQGGILIWLVFVAACGLSIWLPTPINIRNLFIVAVMPSLVLLGSALAIYGIPQFLDQAYCGVISALPGQCHIPTGNVMLITLFVFMASIPGIIAGVYARNQLVSFIKWSTTVKPSTLTRIEKLLNSLIRIGAIVMGIFVLAR
jgi:hypothetical protein